MPPSDAGARQRQSGAGGEKGECFVLAHALTLAVSRWLIEPGRRRKMRCARRRRPMAKSSEPRTICAEDIDPRYDWQK
ncbi:MAG: hypothetical protein ACREFQ_17630, partial [Stellaceae bacterium]